MPLTNDELLSRHTQLFNRGVRSGDFAPMLVHFSADAALIFTGVPFGPFSGRDEIAEAYRVAPPDDEIRVLQVADHGDEIRVSFAWLAAPDEPAGIMIITHRADKISRLVILYGAL